MKKILALAVGMLLIPFTAFGMEAMSDGDMDSITGQSGVAISVANIQVYQTGGDELWYRGGSDDAAVGLVYGEDTASYTFITSIKSLGEQQVGLGAASGDSFARGDYDAINNTSGAADDAQLTFNGVNLVNEMPDFPRVLSIRVLEGSQSTMFGGADTAHIEIGLPTVEIVGAEGGSEELNLYIGATTDQSSPVGSDENTSGFASMGTLYMSNSGSTTAIFGGAIGITAVDSGNISDLLVMDLSPE